MAVSQEDADEWVEIAGRLRYDVFNFDRSDERSAREAIANFMSEFGSDVPSQAGVEMFEQLLELGYLTALRRVRDGEFDGELEEWGRPDLSG